MIATMTLHRKTAPAEPQPSKTRRKREMLELQDLGTALLGLNEGQVQRLELPEALHDALRLARGLTKHGALRRQRQYIGRLMREVDPAPIRAQLEAWQGYSRADTALHHLAERWRDRLMEEDLETVLEAWAQNYSAVDLQGLRALARIARQEQAADQPPRNYRALYREVRGLLESQSDSTAFLGTQV
jgi:ribosome-associated protein